MNGWYRPIVLYADDILLM